MDQSPAVIRVLQLEADMIVGNDDKDEAWRVKVNESSAKELYLHCIKHRRAFNY